MTRQKLKVKSHIQRFVWTDLPETNILPRRMFREQNKANVKFHGIFMIFTIRHTFCNENYVILLFPEIFFNFKLVFCKVLEPVPNMLFYIWISTFLTGFPSGNCFRGGPWTVIFISGRTVRTNIRMRLCTFNFRSVTNGIEFRLSTLSSRHAQPKPMTDQQKYLLSLPAHVFSNVRITSLVNECKKMTFSSVRGLSLF